MTLEPYSLIFLLKKMREASAVEKLFTFQILAYFKY